MDADLLAGARQAISTCLGIQQDERVVIITDVETKEVSEALLRVAEESSPGNVSLFIMEDYGERSLDGNNSLVFPDELRTALLGADVSIYAAASKKGELQTFRMPMMRLIEDMKTIRHAHMPGITSTIMKMGMNADYGMIKKRCEQLYALAKSAEKITVVTPAGTNITAHFSPDIKWIICDGDITKPGKWTNLPDGEIFTCPLRVDGVVVADGVLGDYFDKKYGLLEKTPLRLHVTDGRITQVDCDNHELAKEFEDYLELDENANKYGEFAIGCNEGVSHLIGNMLQDEKFPGVHIAVGDPYGKLTGATWTSKAHCDMVLQKCTIYVNDELIMKDGKFVI